MKILIVDDSAPHLILLEQAIAPLGYEIIRAEDGEAGWKAFQIYRPRIIISDWMMPKMSGLDLCQRVRMEMRKADGAAEYTYFILVTAAKPMNTASLREAMDKEVDDFLSKPFSEESICGRIRVAERILGLNQRLADLESLIPICAYCKRVRKENGEYEPVESYIRKRSPLTFSHGICHDCKDKGAQNAR
ncbi:MAG: response regulator [Elusimicrobia bacterium]|nr:response regulator [Elusimicrobiota bacterium]